MTAAESKAALPEEVAEVVKAARKQSHSLLQAITGPVLTQAVEDGFGIFVALVRNDYRESAETIDQVTTLLSALAARAQTAEALVAKLEKDLAEVDDAWISEVEEGLVGVSFTDTRAVYARAMQRDAARSMKGRRA